MPAEATPPPLLLHVFSTFAVGGPQIRFVTLARAFGDRYRHVVIAMDDDLSCAQCLPAGLDVRYERIEEAKGTIATIGNVHRFRRRLREIAPDVLVTYSWGATEWALANVPRLAQHVHVEDGFGPEELARQIRRRVWVRRLALARSVVVVPSRTLWRIATETWRLDPRHVRYVPNGVDLAHFAGPHTTGSEPVIGTVAALRPVKNLARLMRAFRLVADVVPARLVIAGKGPELPSLEQLAVELRLGGRVEFTGHLHDPAALYHTLDVFALSSDTEQMPLAVIEAMASGLPISATAVGDVPKMVATENQPFVTSADDMALARAMLALVQNPALRERVGMANRAKAEAEFDEQTMVAGWRAVFETLADAAAPAPFVITSKPPNGSG
jgi:glycosyltransferase involved in cell wall biosynthesis